MDELKKYLPNISFGTVIVAFFLPFVLIKCSGEEIANLSGFELVTGKEIGSASEFSDKTERVNSNIFAIISFACAIIGLVIVFLKVNKWKLIALIFSIVGLISQLLLYNDVKSEAIEGGGGMLTISLGLGFYLAFIAYFVNSIYLGIKVSEENKAAT